MISEKTESQFREISLRWANWELSKLENVNHTGNQTKKKKRSQTLICEYQFTEFWRDYLTLKFTHTVKEKTGNVLSSHLIHGAYTLYT